MALSSMSLTLARGYNWIRLDEEYYILDFDEEILQFDSVAWHGYQLIDDFALLAFANHWKLIDVVTIAPLFQFLKVKSTGTYLSVLLQFEWLE
jgi:hypothetical protein